MARYKKYEHLPWWVNNYNHDTLTPTQKEVLDLDYYCKKFGTKLSHQQAADMLHRGRHTVYTARRRLAELGLRTTEPAKGSFKLGHPIEYQDEADWLAVLRAHGVDPRRFKMKRKSVQKKRPLRGLSSSQVSEASAAEAAEAGISLPQTPAGLTDRCSGEAGESSALRKANTELVREMVYKGALSKLLKVGWKEETAKILAKRKTDDYIADREARLKSREEKRIEDRQNKKPNSS